MLQKQGFLKEGTPQLTSNHQSTKIGHPSCEISNEAPVYDVILCESPLSFKIWYFNDYIVLLL